MLPSISAPRKNSTVEKVPVAAWMTPPVSKTSSHVRKGSHLEDDSWIEEQLSPRTAALSRKSRSSPRTNRIKAQSTVNNQKNAVTYMYSTLKSVSHTGSVAFQEDLNQLSVAKQSVRLGKSNFVFGEEHIPESAEKNNTDTRNYNLYSEESMNMEKSLLVASGTINAGNRVLVYTVKQYLGTCFSVNFVVATTGQAWVVFIPTTEAISMTCLF